MANGIALLNNDKNKQLYDDLFKNKPDYSIVSSSPKIFSAIHKDDFNEDFYLSDSELDAYIEGFLDAVDGNIGEVIKNVNEEDSGIDFEETAMDDDDIKLSLYRSFKSLYDKWISNSGDSSVEGDIGYFFNNYGLNDNRSLYDHFKFINRVGNDIGGVAVIDPSYLTNIGSNTNGEGPTQSLYQVMTNLLGKNNFDFWPTPSNNPILTNNLTNEEAEDMFRPIDSPIVNNNSGPMYNCVYVGGSSRTLKDLNSKDGGCNLIDNQYQDDSFDLGDSTGTDWPEEFKNIDSNILLFKVRYGQESQSHFYGVELDQTEFKETQESLSIIDKLTNPKKGSSPSQYGKGNSMFDLYLTRSYNCRVSSLGNMSIQPLLYFKLENVPMFRGTYLINEVTHKITENKIETTFNGLRQPKITIPIVKDPISILDLVLSEQDGEGSDGTFDLSEGYISNVEVKPEEVIKKGCLYVNKLVEDLGLTKQQASGVIGNLIKESNLVPNILQGGKRGKITESGNGGYGWAQWTTKSLKDKFIEFANKKSVNLETTEATDEINYEYLKEWITNIEGNLFDDLKKKNNVFESAKYFAQKYERCALCETQNEWQERSSYGQQVFDSCNS